MQTKEIIDLFINGEIAYEDIASQSLECKYGIKLIQKESSRSNIRVNQTNKEWLINKELGWGGSLSNEFPIRWDVTTDGTMACYRSNFVEHILYDIVLITLEERFDVQKELAIKEAEAIITANVVQTLTKALVQEMMPFSKVSSGFLEITYGIHLKQTQRDEHRFMNFKPRYGKVNWVANNVLCWGSNTGWDITTDGKIACCRINYDDYVNFEIQTLTADQIEEYKTKFSCNSSDSLKKLQVLKSMLDAKLISPSEYSIKKSDVLKNL